MQALVSSLQSGGAPFARHALTQMQQARDQVLEQIAGASLKIATATHRRDDALAFLAADSLPTEAADFRAMALSGEAVFNAKDAKRFESELEHLNKTAQAFDDFSAWWSDRLSTE